jgi:CRISPR-associated protein Cmr6
MSLILPQSTLDLLERVPLTSRHPGLQLDKFSIPGDQTIQKRAIENVIRANDMLVNPNVEFQQLRQRWLLNMQSGAVTATLLRCTTIGPLTLHLSRASALENAGICLHPLYGFVYLPGSGLKGMARAFAETVWLPAQSDAKAAWRKIEDVFGWAPNPERKQHLRDPKHPAEKRFLVQGDPKSPEIKSHVGNIIFHDAWPETWPKLIVDIVNNHHPDYYQYADNEHAPGDWENPKPVYFLAAAPGVTFTFPLMKCRNDVPDGLLSLASEWLLGALCHLGAGAKTNAGYGAFAPADNEQTATLASVASTWKKATEPSKHRAEFSTTLELVTPAFLAGANQQAEDCDLRPATLRGHLRWWWRTMHAGNLDVQTLRKLEAAIWGNTKSGGAVRIVVTSHSAPRPLLFDHRVIADRNDLPLPPDRKTTRGLAYFSYGMNDAGRQRYFLAPLHSWNLRIVARPLNLPDGDRLTAEDVLSHAKKALWLLSSYGGVGAKSRKGFGGLALSAELSQFASDPLVTSATQQWVMAPDIETSTSNYWQVLDRIGVATQAFSKTYKHRAEKQALGLPRRIGPPVSGKFQAGPNVRRSNRHTSPLQAHLSLVNGYFVVRFTAFPSSELPDLATSRHFLRTAVDEIARETKDRVSLVRSITPVWNPSQPIITSVAEPARELPKPGDRVQVTLLPERTKKGGWQARHESSNLSGPIQNSALVPPSSNAGDTPEVIVAFCNDREIAFRWPTAVDIARSQKPSKTPKHRRR